jgi:hypothetical protein
VQEVAGSNPVHPTKKKARVYPVAFYFAACEYAHKCGKMKSHEARLVPALFFVKIVFNIEHLGLSSPS